MAQMKFMVMTDENVANAIFQQLVSKGVNIVRLIDMLPEGTPDPDVLEYCHEHGYSLVTFDKHIRSHIDDRTSEGKKHAGVFIGATIQGEKSIGIIVEFVVFYDQAIKSDAATVADDVYNQIIYVK